MSKDLPPPATAKPPWVLVAALALAAVALVGCKDDTASSGPSATYGGSAAAAGVASESTAAASATDIQMATWARDNIGRFDRVTGLISSIDGDSSVAEVLDMCQNLRAAVASAQNGLPVPDPEINTHYSGYLGLLESSSSLCVTGITENSAATLRLATSQLAEAGSEIRTVTALLNKYAP